MENKLLKIFNPEKANQLIQLGFKYVTETVNGYIVHSFFITEELMDYVNSKFDEKDFFPGNRLTF